MAYKFQVGAARLSGSTTFEDSLVANQSFSAQSLSASAGLEIGGTVRLDGVADTGVALASDSFYFFDADDNLVKKESMADYATAIAGDGLAASSGVLAVGVDDSSIETNSDALRVKALGVTNAMLAGSITDAKLNQITTGDKVAGSAVQLAGTSALEDSTGLQLKATLAGDGLAMASQILSVDLNELTAAAVNVGADSIAIIDADDSNGSRKESIADLMTAVAGDGLAASSGVLAVGVDDSTVELNSDALRVKAAGITEAHLATSVAGDGLSGGGGSALALDLNELTAAAVDVANDSIAIVDANDSNGSKKESIADLISAIAGAGLSAASGVLAVDGNSVTAKDFSSAVALSSGYNVPDANAMGGAIIATLPAPTEVGYTVAVKAPSSCSDTNTVTIQGGTMDGQTSLVLESPGAAVTLICIDTGGDSWIVM